MPISGLTFSGIPIGESGYNPWSPSSNFGSGSDLSQEELYKRAQEELLNNSNQYPDVENITSPYDSQMAGLTQQQLDAQKQLSQPESKTSKVTNGIMGLLSAIAMIRDMTNKSRSVRARAPRNVAAGMDVIKQAREEAQRKKQDEYTRTMQAIQAQKEDVQNSIRTAMSKAELKSANTARKAQALNAVEKPAQPKLPTAEESAKEELRTRYKALVQKYPGASMKDLAKIAYETDARLYAEYFSKDYPQADPEESKEALREKYQKYFSDFYQAEIKDGTPVKDALIKARAMLDALMAADAGPGDYQPPALNLTPPSFPMNDFDINQTPWLKLQEERKRRGGLSYDEYNKSSAVPAGGAKNSSYYKW
jgi:hypothetical protein